MTDRIAKTIDLDAPIARVWRALTNHEEFGQWFRVRLGYRWQRETGEWTGAGQVRDGQAMRSRAPSRKVDLRYRS